MAVLPARPDLDQLRHQAKDLLRAANSGDAAAAGRIRAVSGQLTLASAQLAIARDYGFASWAQLKAGVQERTGDTVAVRLLLEAGADPGRPLAGDPPDGPDAADRPVYPVGAAVESGCPAELIELLLSHGADPSAPGQDGSSPYRVAIRRGRTDIAALLTRHGASAGNAETDRFLSACRQEDRTEVEQLVRRNPGLAGQLASADQAALVEAASEGLTGVVRLMLDAGFPLDARGEHGATALHAAAYSGSADTVRLLLDRGADIESRDTSWDSTALDWAMVGSGYAPGDNPRPDWIATVRTLLEAGASIAEVTLSPDDLKPPSEDVARLLRSYGVRDEAPGSNP